VQVVTAHVTDGYRLALRGRRRHSAREGQARLLGDRKRVELRSPHDGRSGTVPQQPDDAMTTHIRRRGESKRSQPLRKFRRGSNFLPGELRIAVKLLIYFPQATDRLRNLGTVGRTSISGFVAPDDDHEGQEDNLGDRPAHELLLTGTDAAPFVPSARRADPR
jgi:hypothetical protein